MKNFKLNKCPLCNSGLIYANDTQSEMVNTKSEEHIIPKSLGNDTLILKKGIICDKCNNYFALNIEKPFLEIQAIKLLRSYHLIESRKKRVPPLNVLFCGDDATMHFDKKSKSMIIEVSPETAYKLIKGSYPSYFFSHTIKLKELENNYNVSRLLVKIFIELYLYYAIEAIQLSDSSDNDFDFIYDNKMNELIKYVRYGEKGKIYEYTVSQTKEILPYSDDNFVANVHLNLDNDTLTGITLNLFELKFVLKI